MDDFIKNNKAAIKMQHISKEDYIGARCCLQGGIITCGYILSAQALEKMLKSHILFYLPDEKFKSKKYKPYHDLEILLSELKNISQFEVDQFQNLCFTLSKTYDGFRYPDNKHITEFGIRSTSTSIIDEVDEMYIYLFQHLPIPNPLKCRIGILGTLKCTNNTYYKHWITVNNKAYLSRVNYFSKPLSWWDMNEGERMRHPTSEIKKI